MSTAEWMPKLNLFGTASINIVVSDYLPTYPTDGADARRIVRHGLADVLEWLGEKVGPKPGEPTHMLMSTDPATGNTSIFTSLHGLSLLKDVTA